MATTSGQMGPFWVPFSYDDDHDDLDAVVDQKSAAIVDIEVLAPDSDSDSTSPNRTYLPHRDIPKDIEPLKFNGKPFEQSSKEHTTTSSTVLPPAGDKPPPRDYGSDRPNVNVNLNVTVNVPPLWAPQFSVEEIAEKVETLLRISKPSESAKPKDVPDPSASIFFTPPSRPHPDLLRGAMAQPSESISAGVRSRPHPDLLRVPSPGAMAQPTESISAGVRSRPPLDITPERPRAASVPPSSSSPLANKNTVYCSGITKANPPGYCGNKIKLPLTHLRLDPTPVVYCNKHRDAMYIAQSGFYIRRPGEGKEERFVKFDDYIPPHLDRNTQLALRVEMEKDLSPADEPGYIYTFEIRDPQCPGFIQLKVGHTVNLVKRLDQWDKQCRSKMQIVRGWWPDTVEDDSNNDGTKGTLLKGNIKPGKPGPLCHRVERLVHMELADLVVHAPYLNPKVDNSGLPSSGMRSPTPKKARMKPCPDCHVAHKEIFALRRPEKGPYKGREWELLVKPVIEKWGKFVSEYYT